MRAGRMAAILPGIRMLILMCGLCLSIQAWGEEDLTEKFGALVKQQRWQEALPVIEEIIDRAPAMATSWRNYGVCLDELGRHDDAAKAFQRAYQLAPTDHGLQYRILRSLAQANDSDGFVAFAETEAKTTPEIFHLIAERPEFKKMVATPGYQNALRKH